MPLFICDECDCIENTACGHYWCKGMQFIDEKIRDKALCSECCPASLMKNRNFGKWHGLFDKQIMDEDKVKEKLKIDKDHFIYLGKFEYLKK